MKLNIKLIVGLIIVVVMNTAQAGSKVDVKFINGVGNTQKQAVALATKLYYKIRKKKLAGFTSMVVLPNRTATLGIPVVSQFMDIMEAVKQRSGLDTLKRTFTDHVKNTRKPYWYSNLQKKLKGVNRTDKDRAYNIAMSAISLKVAERNRYLNGAYSIMVSHKGYSYSKAKAVKDIAYYITQGIDEIADEAKNVLTSYRKNATYKDYKRIYYSVTKSIKKGNNVLLIGHSQGNIFGNMVLAEINDTYNTKMISVANAYSKMFNRVYNFTWREDLVMKTSLVGYTAQKYMHYYERAYPKTWKLYRRYAPSWFYGFVLSSNKRYLNDATGHGFVDAYINDRYAGRKILDRIAKDYNILRNRS